MRLSSRAGLTRETGSPRSHFSRPPVSHPPVVSSGTPPVGLDAGQAKLHVNDTRRKRAVLQIVNFLLSKSKH